MWTKLRVLITGAAGQLGQAFKRLFTKLRIEHILADVNQTYEGVRSVDITKLSDLRGLLENNPVDYIINCAAYNDVDRAEDDWRTAFLVNGLGTRNLATVSNEIGASLIHYSTDYVFDGTKNAPYTISDIPAPICKYGESKLLGETLLQHTASDYYLIRISWLFGMGNVNFPTKILELAHGLKELRIVDDQISCPTLTDDLARATYDLINARAVGLFHITNSGYCSRYDWAEYILKKTGWAGRLTPAKSSDFETAAERPKFSVLDNLGTEETIGYVLPHWRNATDRFLEQMGLI